MRDDFLQFQLRLKHGKMRQLKQQLARADSITDPVNRASVQDGLRKCIREVEVQIDELLRRA